MAGIVTNRIIKNASWIIICRIVQSILALVISMLTARYLGPSNFGLINYAASVVAFVVPIMQLGITNVLVQEIINKPDKEGEILGTSLCMCFVSSLLCMIGVISFSYVANHDERETIIVVALYSVLLLCQSFEIIQYWFQAKLLSKYTSIAMLISYLVVSCYKIFLLVTAKSVYWFAISNALDYFFISISLLILYKRLGHQPLKVTVSMMPKLFNKSKYYILSNMMIAVFSQTDRIMLKLMGNSADTGYYSAAVACAGLTGFVFTAIIDSVRPSIFEYKKVSIQKYKIQITRLYSIIIYLSLAQSLLMTLFAKIIILVLYGNQYEPSIMALQIVVWYTTFAYIGAVRNIWMLSEGKQKYLWIINLSGALANVLLNLLLIPRFGIYGASVASLTTQLFANVFIGYVFKPIKDNNKLMIAGVNPRVLFELVYKLIN